MQDQEAVDLAAGEHRVVRHRGVHLVDVTADHVIDLRVPGQFLIGGIGDVVALGPVADRGQVDVDEGGAAVTTRAKDDSLKNAWVELELVFHVFGSEEPAIGQFADVLGAVDDAQVPRAFLEEPRIPRGNPALGVLGRGGAVGVVVILDESSRRAIVDFTVLADLHLDPRRGHADGVGADLAVGLLGDEDRGLGLAVELLQVDAERAVEVEDLRPDRLARGIADADAREAEGVLQRPEDEEPAKRIAQPVEHADRFAVEDRGADPAGQRHVMVEQPFLHPPRIFHADHHLRQLAFEYPRRGEEIGRPDLAQVGHHRRGVFRAVHGEARPIGLSDREDEIADPGHRQIGEHLFETRQPVEGDGVLCRLDDVAVRQNHALRLAGGARGVEHHAGAVIGQLGDAGLEFLLIAVMPCLALGDDIGERVHPGMVVFPHAALVGVHHVLDRVDAVLDLDNLVDLLLIAADDEARAAMAKDIGHLLGHRVLIERHRHRAAHLRRHHRPVMRRAVAPDDRDVIAARDTEAQQPHRQGADFLVCLGPGPALPDPEFLFAIGRIAAIPRHVPRQKRRNRLRGLLRRRSVRHVSSLTPVARRPRRGKRFLHRPPRHARRLRVKVFLTFSEI
ncbi:hypothetical protein SDC9_06294 [bioreactor metagenome]|uniref:Uncharacterized protein n=1 Tax=bioreactor metagenome TaxID=1076179 RepID=A0A644T1E2_9ZZZZ